MKSSRRGLNHIRTLGGRAKAGGGDHRSLMRASVIESELQRLNQERRLLEQRIALIEDSANKLRQEKEQLFAGLRLHHSEDARRRPESGRTFHLKY